VTDKNELTAAMGRRRPAGIPTLTAVPTPPPFQTVEDVVHGANRSVGKPYPKRVALDLTNGQLRALREAHVDDGIPITTRVRALVRLWMERPDLAKEAAELAAKDVEAARQARSNSRLSR
jgi:hypothetical protein